MAKYVREIGYDAYGYDTSPTAMNIAEKSSIKKAINFSEFDVYILCVSTHKPGDLFSPQIDGLLSVVEKLSTEAKNGALLSIESIFRRGHQRKYLKCYTTDYTSFTHHTDGMLRKRNSMG